jgi:hypothetical protein
MQAKNNKIPEIAQYSSPGKHPMIPANQYGMEYTFHMIAFA